MHMMRSLKALARVEGWSCARSGAEKLATRMSAQPTKTTTTAATRMRGALIIGMAYASRYARGGGRGLSLSVQNDSRLAAGNERENGAEHGNTSSEPNPFHQRIQVRVNDRSVVFGIASGVDDVEIAGERRVQRDDSLRDLARGVEAALRIEHHARAIAFEDFDGGTLGVVIGVGGFVVILRYQRVRPDVHL